MSGQKKKSRPKLIEETVNDRRQYGDMMADEGEVSSIPTIILIMYGGFAVYAYVLHLVTGDPLWTVPVYYLGFMTAFYYWHYMAHSTWTGEMHRLHMDHHLHTFPPTDFYGDKDDAIIKFYGKKPTMMDLMNITGTIVGNIWHEGPLYVFMGLILVLGRVYLQTSWLGMFFILMFASLMGIIGNAFHMSFHVRDFEYEKYQWYMELRMLHYIHHLGDMKSNLAMVNLGMDGIFGSMMVDDPMRNRKDRKTGKIIKWTNELTNDDYPDGLNEKMMDKIREAAGL